MIYEFALEPELVATWVNRTDYRYFYDKFGLGQPRVVARYPKQWKKLVWDAYQGPDDLDRKRLEELLVRLTERMVRRAGVSWSADRSWLDNALAEHHRAAFHAIVARGNPDAHPHVVIGADLGKDTPRWVAPHGVPVARRATDMADAVAAMLRISNEVIFVDPHFGPENARFSRPLRAFLAALVDGRDGAMPSRVEVHTGDKAERTFFLEKCGMELPRHIPRGLRVVFRRWKERDGGEKLHNRYVLTDLGGVSFHTGLDDGADGETDDVHLLDREQYRLRWSQYADDPPAFDLAEDPLAVLGIAPPRASTA
jgi:hypothetical protein